MTDDQSWGFAIQRTDREFYWDKDSRAISEPRFTVWLPHQCDKWEIAGDSESGRAEWWVTQSEALAELDRFIDEATEAREALAKGAEYGDRHRHMFLDD